MTVSATAPGPVAKANNGEAIISGSDMKPSWTFMRGGGRMAVRPCSMGASFSKPAEAPPAAIQASRPVARPIGAAPR